MWMSFIVLTVKRGWILLSRASMIPLEHITIPSTTPAGARAKSNACILLVIKQVLQELVQKKPATVLTSLDVLILVLFQIILTQTSNL